MSPIFGQATAGAQGCDEGEFPIQEAWSWAAFPAHSVGRLLVGLLGLLWLPAPGSGGKRPGWLTTASSNQITRQLSFTCLSGGLSQNSPNPNPLMPMSGSHASQGPMCHSPTPVCHAV